MPEPLDEMRSYLGFGRDDEEALRGLLPRLPGVLDDLVADFYAVIVEHAEARAVLADGAQIERLKISLADWVTRLLRGPLDADWFERSSRIGRRHVEVGLPQRYMPLAIGRIRWRLVRLAQASQSRAVKRRAAMEAVDKAIDLALAVMLESYAAMSAQRVSQSERLATVGQLAARVGHELKNPLGVINTSVLLIQRQLPPAVADGDGAPVRAHLDRIARNAKQAARMTSQLLDYARAKQPRARTVALSSLLQEAIAMVEERGDGVRTEVTCEPPDATASVDPADLTQALANLVRNAVQAIRDSGRGGCVVLGARRDDVGVAFSVSDDGPGIDPQHLERIFDPLYTTRPDGAGLGLSIARELIEAQGGRITVASAPGRGAQFTVHLPQERAARRRPGS